MIINFENAASHKYFAQNAESLRIARSDMTGHSFLVLIQKWHKLCFGNSSCKLLSFNNCSNSSLPWQVCGLLKFQLCVIGVTGGGAKGSCLLISSISCCFLLWDAVTQTKYCCSLEVKNFCAYQTFGLALRYCCVWFADPTFPESKSKVLLKLCVKILTLV